jgi:hypothetical protein
MSDASQAADDKRRFPLSLLRLSKNAKVGRLRPLHPIFVFDRNRTMVNAHPHSSVVPQAPEDHKTAGPRDK